MIDQGTDSMTVVFGKEKGGYATWLRSGVKYMYFDLPRNKQASNKRVVLLQCQTSNERCEREEKEEAIKNLSYQVAQT